MRILRDRCRASGSMANRTVRASSKIAHPRLPANSEIAGQFIWKPGYKDLNSQIEGLRNRAWPLANDINRNHSIERS
ncbi:conserved hypothetical protein [Ricinus communis]|uniref:Uncharacterized protein n=1 Tax=Ricinus communis TaxID=3988 RepID=B9THG7_RICCO|nr:conserved hypothetical protein [Ricinus communis]